jgi:signal transduction histidine kinase/ligand-binding sensor domain-containing protein
MLKAFLSALGHACAPSRRALRLLIVPAAVGMLVLGSSLAQAEHLPLRVYSIADGLAGDHIRVLLQDSGGFLWAGTPTGLSRFDGREFASFSEKDGLPSADINALIQQRDGTLWVGTGGGLAMLRADASDPHPFEVVSTDLRRPHDIRALAEDRAGAVWVATVDGLQRLRRRGTGWDIQPVDFRRQTFTYVSSLAVGDENDVWVGTESGLYRVFANGRVIHYPLWSDTGADEIHQLEWRDGRLFIIYGQGLYIWKPLPPTSSFEQPMPAVGSPRCIRVPETGAPTPPEAPGNATFVDFRGPNQRVDGYFVTRDGRRWLVGNAGLEVWDGTTVHVLTTLQGLPHELFKAWIEDRDGNLWLGSESRGLFRLSLAGMTGYGIEDGFASDRIAAIAEDRAGHLLARGGNLIYQFDGSRFRDVTPTALRSLTPGWGWNQVFLQDPNGEFWFATGAGLLRMPAAANLAGLKNRTPVGFYRPPEIEGGIFRVWMGHSGDLWLATQNPDGCVVRDHRTGAFKRLGAAEGLPDRLPTIFSEDDSGNLWVGFFHGGVARSRDHRHFEVLGAADGVPSGSVTDFLVDRNHALWVGTAVGGAARFRDPNATHPRAELAGPVHGGVTCLSEDREGWILLGNTSGVDRLDPRTGSVEHWTTGEGLTNNMVTVTHRDRQGAVWFGSGHGIARLSADPEPLRRPPPVLLVGLRVNGEALHRWPLGVAKLDTLRLRADGDRLEVDFAGAALGRPQDLQYETRLAGLDPTWGPAAVERTVTFPRLPSGRYRLEVRARYIGVDEPGPVAVLPLWVVPPFYQRGWFVTAVAFGLLGTALAWHRLRMRRLVAAERLRSRIAADLHDDLGTSLAQVSILTELGRRHLAAEPGDPERVGGVLGEIGETARELLDALADTVWAVDPRQDDLASLLARVEQTARELLEPQGIDVRVDVTGEVEGIAIPPERRRQLFLLLKEALHNASRHSRSRNVRLTFTRLRDRLDAEVRDDGIGMSSEPSPPRLDGGRGMPSMRERAQALGSQLFVDSAPGKGTIIRLSVLLA